MKRHQPPQKHGFILLIVLVFFAVFTLSSAALLDYTRVSIRSERTTIASAQALALAEAGLDKAAYQLNQSSSYSGETLTALGSGFFTISIATVNSGTKRVTSTGYVKSGTSATTTRTIKANLGIDATVVSFRYGVQTGNGGLSTGNGSTVTGNVYSGGNITGSGTITGDATVSSGIASTPDQSWTTQNTATNIADDTSRTYVAQSFTPSASATLNRVSLYVKKTGEPASININIQSDNAGTPGAILATSTLLQSWVTGSYFYIDLSLNSLASLTGGQKYWIVASGPVSATDYYTWGGDSGFGYTGGSSYTSADGTAWVANTPDLNFRVYLAGTALSIAGVRVNGNAWAQSMSGCTVIGTAKYKTTNTCSVTGLTYPNTNPATPAIMPISDAQIDEWETLATAGGTTAGPYSVSGTVTLGPRKINGNLTVTNGAVLILSGPVWVKGNIDISNNGTLRLAASTGASGAVLIADNPGSESGSGSVSLSNNVVIEGNGTSGAYPMIISTNTSGSAISLSNNASGVILYAPYGTVQVSNNAGAAEITANRLQLSNNATISYVNGLQNTSFSNGTGASWIFVPGTYAITN